SGEAYLLFPLAEPGAVFAAVFANAGRAADALFIGGMLAVRRRNRAAAGTAALVITGYKAVPDRDAAIEDIAFPLPERGVFGHLLEIFQDAALEVEDILNPLGNQVIG